MSAPRSGGGNDDDDDAWLHARERGEKISHIAAPVCARYAPLEQLLAELPDPTPGPRFRQRVLDAIGSPAAVAPRPRPRPRWFAAGSVAAAAIVLAIWLPRGAPTAPKISVAVRRGDAPHRGDDVSIGDVLVVEVAEDRPFELRIYGDTGEPLARCAEAEGCGANARPVRFELVLSSPGDVRTLLFAGDAMPPVQRNLEADLEAAEHADVEVREVSRVRVR